jgi:carboxypeptidase Taq
MTRFSDGDIRITTRFDESDLTDGLFSTIHEAGHALYEQNISREYDSSPLGAGASAGVHESQSRLWENLVARSQPFWDHFLPQLRTHFPGQFEGVSVDAFCRGINRVKRSLIRVDADELTYNLHVMLRFELELELLEGNLSVADLPAAWNDRMERDLGVRPPDDRDGVLQDVHWYCETVGGLFQGYTLGNMMSAQIFSAASKALPEVEANMTHGNFAPLRMWLTDNLYQHGARYEPETLVERASGSPLSAQHLIDYLHNKYSVLYNIPR